MSSGKNFSAALPALLRRARPSAHGRLSHSLPPLQLPPLRPPSLRPPPLRSPPLRPPPLWPPLWPPPLRMPPLRMPPLRLQALQALRARAIGSTRWRASLRRRRGVNRVDFPIWWAHPPPTPYKGAAPPPHPLQVSVARCPHPPHPHDTGDTNCPTGAREQNPGSSLHNYVWSGL
jgi:hypothetical protein